MEGQGPGTPGHPAPGSSDPTHHMPPSGQTSAPEPSEQPTQAAAPPPPPPPGFTVPANWPAGARLTVPGNAEWAMWFFVELLFAIIWAASDQVGAGEFVIVTAIVTFGYLISRGIAKASRVLEH
jgi:hypothetical protein